MYTVMLISCLLEPIKKLFDTFCSTACSPYEDRLHRLNIFCRERRRLRGYLDLAVTIFHERFDLSQAESLEAPAEGDIQVAPPYDSFSSEESRLLGDFCRLTE